MDVDAIFNQELHKVHPVQNQSVHHGLFQGVHLYDTRLRQTVEPAPGF